MGIFTSLLSKFNRLRNCLVMKLYIDPESNKALTPWGCPLISKINNFAVDNSTCESLAWLIVCIETEAIGTLLMSLTAIISIRLQVESDIRDGSVIT